MTDRGPPGADHPRTPADLTAFQDAVAAVVAALEPGEVVTYGDVAMEVGRPGAAQAVANVLRRVPGLPWWRVVPSGGRLYRSHAPTQEPLLLAEGVRVDADRRVVRGCGADRLTPPCDRDEPASARPDG